MEAKTALDWYYQQTVIEGKTNYHELLQQAKEIEQKEIYEIHVDGVEQGFNMCLKQKQENKI